FALSRAEASVKFSAAFASLAVDRLFDGTVVLLLMIAAMLDPAFGHAGTQGTSTLIISMRLAALFLAAVLGVLTFIVVSPTRVHALHDMVMVRVAPKVAPRTRSLLEGFASGLEVLRSPKLVAEVFFWTVLHWLCNAFAFWLGFQALGIQAPFSAALLIQGIIAIGVAIPSSPGFFGVFEAGGKIGLALYGLGDTQAVSWALGFHVLSYIPITLLGAWYLTRLKLHFSDFGGAGKPGTA
ncbi:MAG: YbhN family protein, partial [Gemmatimonadales bacterium]